jgi:hypothetical protein
MALGWFSKKEKGNTGTATAPIPAPAIVPEVTPLAVPVADLEPEPVVTLLTEPATPPAAMEIPLEKIAALAYEIWVEKGRPPGTELQNWLEAETELRMQLAASAPKRAPIRKPR